MFGISKGVNESNNINSSIVRFVFCLSVLCLHTVGHRVTHSGPGLDEVAETEAQMFSFAQKLNRRTTVELCSFAPLLQNPCYQQYYLTYFFLSSSQNLSIMVLMSSGFLNITLSPFSSVVKCPLNASGIALYCLFTCSKVSIKQI